MVESVCSCSSHQQPRCAHFRMGRCAEKVAPPIATSSVKSPDHQSNASPPSAERDEYKAEVEKLKRIVSPGDSCPDCMGVALHFKEMAEAATSERDALQHDIERLRKTLGRAREYIDLYAEPCSFSAPEMVAEIDAALATLRVTDAERS